MKPHVLLIYYSFTQQTRRVATTMAEVFEAQGCQVSHLEIRMTDERYQLELPLRPFWRRMLKLVLPQLLGGTCQIEYDQALLDGDYDLVCIGSPTWWFYPALPLATFLKSTPAQRLFQDRRFAVFAVCRAFWRANVRTVKRLARRAGGEFADAAAFVFQGNQIQSMFSFLSYLQRGTDQPRYLGCRIYPFGVTADGIDHARSFAETLVPPTTHAASDPSPAPTKEPDMSRQQFLGTWKLVSSTMVSGDHVIYPLGEKCQGIITFDDAGKLNGQMMNPERPNFASDDMLRGTPEEIQSAYQGYVAFWANYTVDEAAGTMSYTVEGSLFPNWVGHHQDRHYSVDGNRLTLKTSPLSLGGMENVVGVLVWERLT